MKSKFYFSHDYNARNDKKLVACSMKHGNAGIGVYWNIIEMLYEEGGYLPLSDFDRIMFELRVEMEMISYLIYESDLFKNDGEKFWSQSAIERLNMQTQRREVARQNADSRWNKKGNANQMPLHEVGNAYIEKKSIEYKYKKNKKKSPNGASVSGFTIPSVEEIKTYCAERKNTINADYFHNFYESKGWMIGKNKMKDWKASIRSWEKRDFANPTDSKVISHPQINTPLEWIK